MMRMWHSNSAINLGPPPGEGGPPPPPGDDGMPGGPGFCEQTWTSCADLPTLPELYASMIEALGVDNGDISAETMPSNFIQIMTDSMILINGSSGAPVVIGCTDASQVCTEVSLEASTRLGDSTSDYFSFITNMVPNHYPSVGSVAMMGSWADDLAEAGSDDMNPNAIVESDSLFCIPKQPYVPTSGTWGPYDAYMWTPTGIVGVSVNGIPIYNPWADMAGEVDAMSQETFDDCGGHPSPSEYHYHMYASCLFTDAPYLVVDDAEKTADPTGVAAWLQTRIDTNDDSGVMIVAWSLDGFPIYGPLGLNSTGAVVLMLSSYDSNQAYTEGSGDLDDNNGIFSATPEFPDGIYHYHATIQPEVDGSGLLIKISSDGLTVAQFPYLNYKFHGVPQLCLRGAGGLPPPMMGPIPPAILVIIIAVVGAVAAIIWAIMCGKCQCNNKKKKKKMNEDKVPVMFVSDEGSEQELVSYDSRGLRNAATV